MGAGPTEKQLRYLATLAGQLGERDEWEMFPGMSRSHARKCATMANATAAIDAAKKRLEEHLATQERRASMPEGSWDGDDVVRIGDAWVQMKRAADIAALKTLQAGGFPVDLPALRLDWQSRRARGSTTPVLDAIAALVAARPAAVAAKLEAIGQIRALMAEHGISVSDLVP
jgi:H-NS histone-like proteins, N-terminal domain